MTFDSPEIEHLAGLTVEQSAALRRRGVLTVQGFVDVASAHPQQLASLLDIDHQQLAQIRLMAQALLAELPAIEPPPVVPPFGLLPRSERLDRSGGTADDFPQGDAS